MTQEPMKITMNFNIGKNDDLMWDDVGLMLEDSEGYKNDIKCPKPLFDFIQKVHECGKLCGRKELQLEIQTVLGMEVI